MALIPGTILDDVLATTAAADVLTALNGNDVVLIALPAHHGVGESLDGGLGFDRLWLTSAAPGTFVLRATVIGFEAVQLADEGGNSSGTTALNLDASLVTVGLRLTGNAGDNSIIGTAKDDVLVGGAGADSLTGGLGNDRVVMGVAAGDTDQANAGLQAEGNTLILGGAAAGIVNVDLLAADQLVSINAVADAPAQSGFSHVDASGIAGFGVQITASAGKNVLIGTGKDDVFLYTDSLHVTSDAVTGGAGNDVLRFTSATALQTLVLGASVVGLERAEIADATGDESGTVTLSLSTALVKNKLMLIGNDGANTITGTAFNDTLMGNGGADALAGGLGNDLYLYDDASDGVPGDKITEAAIVGSKDYIAYTSTVVNSTLVLGASITGVEGAYATGLDSLGAKFDVEEVFDRNIDGSALLATFGLAFNGNAGANALTGGKGKDTLTGGKGTDSIIGGLGGDVVVMDIDPVSIDVIDAGDAAEGNTLRLVGKQDNGEALIDLGAAADADQVSKLDGAADALIQSDFTHLDASGLTGKFGVTVTGTLLGNILTGSGQADVFGVVSSLHLTLADSFQGGGGNDTLRFTSTIAGQSLVIGAGISGVEEVEISDIDGLNTGLTTLSMNAFGSKSKLILSGNDGSNTLTGSTFGDTLNGNGGNDLMVGGFGDDEYLYDDSADLVAGERITEILVGGGTDTVRFASVIDGQVLTLPSTVLNIELLVLDEPADETIVGADIGINAAALANGVTMTGNEGNNTLTGTKFADRIQGGKGIDSIVGGLGKDTIIVSVDPGDQDDASAGLYTEHNLLMLEGKDEAVDGFTYDIDLSVAAGADQSGFIAGVQSGFAHVDATLLRNGYVNIIGSSRGESMVGSNYHPDPTILVTADIFTPGLGNDTVRGGAGDDDIIVHSQAEMNGDVYSDSGGTAGDYLYFESLLDNKTLNILDSMVNGVDVAAAGAGSFNLNINASAVLKPFSLAGNAGRNVLTSTSNGESLFDYGGADTMNGGLGSDDYVIAATWVSAGVYVDKINDIGGTQDDMYNATASQIIIVNPATITGIERFVVSSTQLSVGGPFVRDIEATNDAGFDLNLWGRGTLLNGSWGDNYLRGTRFNDTINGSKGEDTIIGGLGMDIIFMSVGGEDNDVPDEINAGLTTELNQWVLSGVPDGTVVIDLGVAEGSDQLISIDGFLDTLVQSGFRHVNASGVGTPPLFVGVTLEITGSAAVNTIYGASKYDILDGRGGADKLYGGAGDDAFVVSALSEYVIGDLFDGGEGNDVVRFASTVAGQSLLLISARLDSVEIAAIEDAAGDNTGLTTLHLSAAGYDTKLALRGNFGDNSITGTSFADTIAGNAGIDTLRGGAGNDVYVALDPSEVVPGDSIIDTLGTGDIFRFLSETDGQVVTLTGLMTGIEFAELANDKGEAIGTKDTGIDASAFATKLTIRGNDGDNTLTGGAFNDAFFGNKGNDSILGGAGADTVTMLMVAVDRDDVDGGDIADAGGNMLVLLGDAGGSSVWDLNAADQLVSIGGSDDGRIIQDMTHIDASGLTGAVTITGSAEANTLIGTADNDIFIVLTAADFAAGELIDGGGGTLDELHFASASGGEILLLTGLVDGIELVELTHASAAVGVNAAAVGNALKIIGNAGANTLTGTAFADTIEGGDGVDSIIGGAGADKITVKMDSVDAVNAGAGGEGDRLILTGAAAGAVTINLALAGDQLSVTGDALVQSGLQHLDAGAVSGFGIAVTGSAGNNSIVGTAGSDVINAGLGVDTISMNVASGSDAINAGAAAEGNILVLTGSGAVMVDLSAAGDQVTGPVETDVQTGFMHLDASAMGGSVNVTGSAAANSITGSTGVDTINGGAGADRIVWSVGAADELDGGSLSDGDTLVLVGTAAGAIVIDYSVAAGSDQVVGAGVAVDFQHLDAAALGSNGVNASGNGLNNDFFGSNQGDTMTGLAGSDRFWLGGGDGIDAAADQVRYMGPQDGVNAVGAAFSFDRIREFKAGQDDVFLTGAFNGGPNDLDDITDNNTLQFATDSKANFSLNHEAMVITFGASLLKTEASVSSFATVVAVINKLSLGVISTTGDDGIIVVQSKTAAGLEFAGVYYYQELDGVLNKVAAGELTLLGVFDAALGGGDLGLL